MIKKGEVSKHRIVEAARGLFYHKGIAVTSVANVADAAGVSKGNLTYYFPTKDALIAAVVEARSERISGVLALWQEKGLAPVEAVEAFICFVESTSEDFARYGCPMATASSELGKDHVALQSKANVSFVLLRGFLHKQFGTVQPANVARDSADHFLVLAEGASVMSHAFRDRGIVRQTANVMRRTAADIFAV